MYNNIPRWCGVTIRIIDKWTFFSYPSFLTAIPGVVNYAGIEGRVTSIYKTYYFYQPKFIVWAVNWGKIQQNNIHQKHTWECAPNKDIEHIHMRGKTHPQVEKISSRNDLSACGYSSYSFCFFSCEERSGCDILDLISCWASDLAYCSSVIRVILLPECRAGLTAGDDSSRITCSRSSDCNLRANSSSKTIKWYKNLAHCWTSRYVKSRVLLWR